MNNKQKKFKFIIYLILALNIITVFSECSPLYKLNPWSDLNIYLTIGRDLLNGNKLYTHLFDHKGPILYFIYTITSLISSTSYFGVYLLEVISFFVFMYYSDKVLSLFSNKNHILYISIISIVVTTCKAFSYGGGSVEELFLPIFQVTNYLCLNKITKNESFTYKECILIGIFACLSFLTKFTLSGYFLGVAICLIVYQFKINKSKVLPCILYTLIAFIVILGITSIYFVINNNFNDFIDTYFVFNLFSYRTKANFLVRVYQMSRAFLFYFKNNIILIIISTFSIIYSFIHFKKSYITLYILSTFASWYFITFIGGRFIAYYVFPISIHMIYMFLFIENHKNVNIIMILAGVISVMISTNIRDINRTKYVQYDFGEIIGDSSLLVYKGYDQGFYIVSASNPGCKYFTTINGEISDADEETIECINTNEIEYLISMDDEIELDNYQLIKEEIQEYDSRDRVYRLYKRIR